MMGAFIALTLCVYGTFVGGLYWNLGGGLGHPTLNLFEAPRLGVKDVTHIKLNDFTNNTRTYL